MTSPSPYRRSGSRLAIKDRGKSSPETARRYTGDAPAMALAAEVTTSTAKVVTSVAKVTTSMVKVVTSAVKVSTSVIKVATSTAKVVTSAVKVVTSVIKVATSMTKVATSRSAGYPSFMKGALVNAVLTACIQPLLPLFEALNSMVTGIREKPRSLRILFRR